MGAVNVYLIGMISCTFAALSIGTAVRLVAIRNSTADVVKKRIGSLKVWWLLALMWSIAAMLGQGGAALLLAAASLLALREYLRLLGTVSEIGRSAIVCVFVCGVTHYVLIVLGASDIAKWAMPVSMLLLLGAIRGTTCKPADYIRTTAGLFWGAMLMIYGLSHALFLFEIKSDSEPLVGTAGRFLFLVLLTEMNDIMQAIVGRKFGKHKITPLVSPNKSFEGLVGGLATTILLSVALAPLMTTITFNRSLAEGLGLSIFAGVLISVSGFLGDINMSAIKRDAGVKDGSSLLPGMGGVIDRIDSLIFTGPTFYYFVVLLNPTQI